ncbi:MAG TPA: hypothetical protein DEB10_07245 [Ruminococcaceae bacterium]|nr:hypothetical protein [Oscillospiraceae bacterium]
MRLKQASKRSIVGFSFTIPWVIGVIYFFIIPMIQSFIYSITDIDIQKTVDYTFKGFGEYQRFFLEDSLFIRTLFNTVLGMLLSVSMVMFFSLFMANILVQKFHGQKLARTIFFLPFIVASGMVIAVIKGDVYSADIINTTQSSQFQITVLRNILHSINLSNGLITTITNMLNSLFEISWKCGLQILIFMSGLQSISPSIKEAAKMEGATGWEYFWKVAFPILTPIFQLNLVYSIIDSFTDYSNVIIKRIYNLSASHELSRSSALAWIYFGIIFLIIGLVFLLIRRRIFYYND